MRTPKEIIKDGFSNMEFNDPNEADHRIKVCTELMRYITSSTDSTKALGESLLAIVEYKRNRPCGPIVSRGLYYMLEDLPHTLFQYKKEMKMPL